MSHRPFLLACAVAASSTTFAATMPKLPVIAQVGVVPPQWDAASSDPSLEPARETIAVAFPAAVRAAHRFRVLSDDLVADSWQSADGRQELRDQFELHAFVGLAVAARGDTVTMTTRLLDPTLRSQLLESETVPRTWLAAANARELTESVEKLVFRLFNRIPVDVAVTSAQGVFVTLSGGSEQGIQVGDEVDVVRTSIKSLHPANGTWLEFQNRALGRAQVIDVKTYTSVARLTKLTYDNAVEVGDGAKIPAISGRARFARMAQNDAFKASGDPATIIVPPLYTSGDQPKPAAPIAAPGTAAAAPPQPANTSDATPAAEGAAIAATEPPADGAPAPQAAKEESPRDPKGPSIWDNVGDGVQNIVRKPFDDVTGYAGPSWWSISSKEFSDSGRFPLWLLNSAGASVTRTLSYKIKTGFGGGVLFGKTAKSSYLGYESHAKIYWEDKFDLGSEILSNWRAGGVATFSGINVEKGKYGGGDWIRGGAFGGVGGALAIGESIDRYDWSVDYQILPLNIGRLGYNGSRKTVESSFAWRLVLGAFRRQPIMPNLQVGGSFELANERETLNNGRRPTLNDYSLKALAKYTF